MRAPCDVSLRAPILIGALVLITVGSLPILAQIPFTEEAAARGVTAISLGGIGNGVGLEDLDGDGDPDIVVTNVDGAAVRFYENDGLGSFTLRATGVGAGIPLLQFFHGVSFCDYDADGDRDIYLTSRTLPNVLLVNMGNWTFVDDAVNAGIADPGVSSSSTWGDYDGDGWVDLYLTNWATAPPGVPIPNPNRLYRNQGDGTFEDVAGPLGVDDPKTGFQSVFFDPDFDGDLDLYLSNDRGQLDPYYHNEFWENVDGTFIPRDDSGAEIAIDSMGVDIGDFNGDHFMDIVCTNSPPGVHTLLLGSGDGMMFTDGTALTGVGSPGVGWGAIFLDYDHDGQLELYSVNSNSLNHFWTCENGFPCTDSAAALGLDDTVYSVIPSRSYCNATADIDGDGDLDLLLQSNNEPIALYINQSGGLGNWLTVDLDGSSPNLDAIGAVVQIDVGATTQWRQVRAGSGYASASSMMLHFGVGTATSIDRVRIRWPNGDLTALYNVATNQHLAIVRSTLQILGDCDQNFIPDVDELVLDAGLDGNLDGIIDSCQVLFRRGDSNADGSVDVGDAVRTLGYLFSGAPVPCELTLDANDDDAADVADAIWVLAYLFNGGAAPLAPFGACDTDPTPLEALGCEDYPCP